MSRRLPFAFLLLMPACRRASAAAHRLVHQGDDGLLLLMRVEPLALRILPVERAPVVGQLPAIGHADPCGTRALSCGPGHHGCARRSGPARTRRSRRASSPSCGPWGSRLSTAEPPMSHKCREIPPLSHALVCPSASAASRNRRSSFRATTLVASWRFMASARCVPAGRLASGTEPETVSSSTTSTSSSSRMAQ